MTYHSLIFSVEQTQVLTKQDFSVAPNKSTIPIVENWTHRRTQLPTDRELTTWFSTGDVDWTALCHICGRDKDVLIIPLDNGSHIATHPVPYRATNAEVANNGNQRNMRINLDDFPHEEAV